MKKTLFITLLALLITIFSITLVSADTTEICEYIKTDLKAEVGKTIPSFIPFKNEKLNAYTLDNDPIGNAIMENSKIKSIECTKTIDDPTIEVFIKDKQTLMDIKESTKKADTINQKIKDKEIIIKGITFTKKIKTFFMKLGIKISALFT